MMLLATIGSGVLAYICFQMLLMVVKELGGTMGITGTGGRLGLKGAGSEGSGPRAMSLDKPPLTNPDVGGQSGGIPGLSKSGGIPGMRGAGGSNLPAAQQGGGAAPKMGGGLPGPTAGGSGGGMGVSANIGLVNLTGISSQNAGVINNLSMSKHQLVGASLQMGTQISNTYRGLGRKRISQNAASILNASNRGRTFMNQRGTASNLIAQGKTLVRNSGISNTLISGDVGRIRTGKGNILTNVLRAKKIGKPNTLYVGKLSAPKTKSITIQQLNSGVNGVAGINGVNGVNGVNGINGKNQLNQPAVLPAGKRKMKVMRVAQQPVVKNQEGNLSFNVNDINLQKNNEYLLQNQRFMTNASNYLAMFAMKAIAMEAKNQGLTTSQRDKLYTLTNVRESTNMPGVQEQKGWNLNDLSRQIVSKVPDLNKRDMERVRNIANNIQMQKNMKRDMLARKVAEERIDTNKESLSALNNLLKDTSSAPSMQFNNFLAENFGIEQKPELSKEQMDKIREEAIKNVDKRQDIPLEQKEEEYEKEFQKEKEEFINENKDERTQAIEELLKEQILSNKEDAERILGKEGADALYEQIDQIKDKKEKIRVQEAIKLELSEQEKYVKKHPELKGASYYDILKERKQEEMNEDIDTAVGMLTSSKEEGTKTKYSNKTNSNNNNRMNNNSNNNNNNNNTVQPTNNQTIYVPRQITEREISNNGMN